MKIVMMSEHDANCSQWRCDIPGLALQQKGHKVLHASIFQRWPDECLTADVVVVQRPTDKVFLDNIRFLKDAGVPIIIEIDDLFTKGALHRTNPAYMVFHPDAMTQTTWELLKSGWIDKSDIKKNTRRETLFACIAEADALTTTTVHIANLYADYTKHCPTYVLPNCWDGTNTNWFRPAVLRPEASRDELWLMFSGSMTHQHDLAVCAGSLREVTRRHPHVKFIVGGDPNLQTTTVKVDPDSYRFLGGTPFHEYPNLLAQADIILAPLAETDFNRAKSDIRLMEAGILEIPFVASPLPAYRDWGVGGLFAKAHQWTPRLEELIAMTGAERKTLALAAKTQAFNREIHRTVGLWEAAYDDVKARVAASRPRKKIVQRYDKTPDPVAQAQLAKLLANPAERRSGIADEVIRDMNTKKRHLNVS